VTRAWAGTIVTTAPSTAHQVFPDLTEGAPARFNLEAPGLLLHQWDGAALTSFNICFPGLNDTFDPGVK
jgi:Icc protein